MKKIIILGGGFAGIYTAKNLQKQNPLKCQRLKKDI